jgi:hypothetical protein
MTTPKPTHSVDAGALKIERACHDIRRVIAMVDIQMSEIEQVVYSSLTEDMAELVREMRTEGLKCDEIGIQLLQLLGSEGVLNEALNAWVGYYCDASSKLFGEELTNPPWGLGDGPDGYEG